MPSVVICSFCNKKSKKIKAFKRCSVCKKDYYCDSKCQQLDWKDHQISCKSIEEVVAILFKAYNALNLDEIMRWKSRFDEIMVSTILPETTLRKLMNILGTVYDSLLPLTTQIPPSSNEYRFELHYTLSKIHTRQAAFMFNDGYYRDQGEAICTAGDHMLCSGDTAQAARLFKKARVVAEQNGFFIVECRASMGLGHCCIAEGERQEEALLFFQNALAAAPLCEHSCDDLEIVMTECVATSLFNTKRYAEAELLMPRLRQLTRKQSITVGALQMVEVHAYFTRTLLYEQCDNLVEAAMEIRALGVLLEEHIVRVLEFSEDFLEMLTGLRKLKIFSRAYLPSDPVLKVWEIYEKVGGDPVSLNSLYFSSTDVGIHDDKHGYKSILVEQ